MTGLEVLGRELSLPHEWRLGGGGKALSIPAEPMALDLPGFRDAGRFGPHSLPTVFGVTLLDERGGFIPTRAVERNWNPARLELRYRTGDCMITERRTVTSRDAFVSQWTIVHSHEVSRQFWVVLWSRVSTLPGMRFGDLEANARGISVQQVPVRKGMRFDDRLAFALGSNAPADSWSIVQSETHAPAIEWHATPFFEQMSPHGLPGHHPWRIDETDHLYLALAYPVEIRPGERHVASFVAAVAGDVEVARSQLEAVSGTVNPIQASEEEWINWFEEAPAFAASNPAYQRLYWSRWAERRLWRSWSPDDAGIATQAAGVLGPEAGAVLENAWRLNNDEALDGLANWLERPLIDAINQPIGLAARRLLALHPDADLLADLERIAEQLVGMEFPNDDKTPGSGMSPNLLRQTFAVDLLRLAEWIVTKDAGDAAEFAAAANALVDAIRLADEEDDAIDTPLAIVPGLVSALDPSRDSAIVEALVDPDRFWTASPLASKCRSHRGFRAEAGCESEVEPNGRVWPALNSLAIDALGTGIERAAPTRRLVLAQLIERTLKLAFRDGRIDRPEFHEHYNPFNGRPATQLGRQRPAGGWPIDHILRYVAGIRPREDGKLIIDPLPFGLEWFTVDRLFVGDREFRVEWDQRTGLSVRVDEEPAAHAPVGRPLAMNLAEHWPTDDEAYLEASA